MSMPGKKHIHTDEDRTSRRTCDASGVCSPANKGVREKNDIRELPLTRVVLPPTHGDHLELN